VKLERAERSRTCRDRSPARQATARAAGRDNHHRVLRMLLRKPTNSLLTQGFT
jgi:hypothetical protein